MEKTYTVPVNAPDVRTATRAVANEFGLCGYDVIRIDTDHTETLRPFASVAIHVSEPKATECFVLKVTVRKIK